MVLFVRSTINPPKSEKNKRTEKLAQESTGSPFSSIPLDHCGRSKAKPYSLLNPVDEFKLNDPNDPVRILQRDIYGIRFNRRLRTHKQYGY